VSRGVVGVPGSDRKRHAPCVDEVAVTSLARGVVAKFSASHEASAGVLGVRKGRRARPGFASGSFCGALHGMKARQRKASQWVRATTAVGTRPRSDCVPVPSTARNGKWSPFVA
jgi:hypothetical protein